MDAVAPLVVVLASALLMIRGLDFFARLANL